MAYNKEVGKPITQPSNEELIAIIRKQATELVLMKNRNKELNSLVSFLKSKVLEYDPSMASQFKAIGL